MSSTRLLAANPRRRRSHAILVLSVLGILALTVGHAPPARADLDFECGLRANGCYAHNGNTSIYVGPYGAFKIKGAIRDTWGRIGWENSVLGYPISNEFCRLRDSGCGTRFERAGGIMYWSPGTGAHYVRGVIGDKYGSMSWENSAFGYPLSDEFCGLLRGGCGQHFQRENGSIYYSPNTGVHATQGLIKGRWAELGWERGELGYPRSDQYVREGTVFQDFEGGWLAWSGGDVYGEPWNQAAITRFGLASEQERARARTLVRR